MSRPAFALAFALALALSSAGCIENMGDLKEALGVVPPPAAAPRYEPPVAIIDAVVGGVSVGAPVQLIGEESSDPQGLALLFSWDFGDGTFGDGAAVAHVYEKPGDVLVRLTVTNAAGLKDEDTLALRVAAIDRAPTVSIRAPAAGDITAPVAFEAVAADPEGAPIAYDWDFGDGATSQLASPTHAFAKPGLYTVAVRVTDAAGQRASASVIVAIDGAWTFEGSFEPASTDPAKITFPVVAGARSVDLALTYDAGLGGINDLEIVVIDGDGNEIDRTDAGLGGAAEREVHLEFADLAAGEWSVRVVKETGVTASWTLTIVEKLS